MKKTEIDVEMYRTKVIVLYGNKEELEKELKKRTKGFERKLTTVPESLGANTIRTDSKKKLYNGFVIVRKDKLEKSDDKTLKWNTLAHELYHMVYKLFKRIGIDSEEAGAYLMGHLFGKAMKVLEEA